MVIKITTEGEVTIIAIDGSLDTNTSKEAGDQLTKLVNEGNTKILVDLSNLDYISSSGLRVFLATSKKLKPLKGQMRVCGLNEIVNEIFEISGFTLIINVFKTIEEAKAGF